MSEFSDLYVRCLFSRPLENITEVLHFLGIGIPLFLYQVTVIDCTKGRFYSLELLVSYSDLFLDRSGQCPTSLGRYFGFFFWYLFENRELIYNLL